jgi:hypothetical protein
MSIFFGIIFTTFTKQHSCMTSSVLHPMMSKYGYESHSSGEIRFEQEEKKQARKEKKKCSILPCVVFYDLSYGAT